MEEFVAEGELKCPMYPTKSLTTLCACFCRVGVNFCILGTPKRVTVKKRKEPTVWLKRLGEGWGCGWVLVRYCNCTPPPPPCKRENKSDITVMPKWHY